MMKIQLQLTLLCFFILNSVSSNSSDWPEFMGPERNGFSSETNIFNKKITLYFRQTGLRR